MKILFVAFINNTHRQLLRKVDDQFKAFKVVTKSVDCLVIGKGGDEFDNNSYTFTFKNLNDLTKSFTLDQEKKLAYQVLNEHLKYNKYDLIYFRYPGGDDLLLNFLSKNQNVIFEHHSNELDEARTAYQLLYKAEKNFGGKCIEKSLGIVGVTQEILDFELSRINKKIPSFLMTNGANTKEIPIVKPIPFNGKYNIIFLANLTQDWQGVDRFIRGLASYKDKKNVQVHMCGTVSEKYIEMIDDYGLKENFVLWGFKDRKDIASIINRCQAAIGVLGIHRKGLTGGPVLKHREYCLRGIPFIYSGNDPDFVGELPFTHVVDANDDPIDFSNIIALADKFIKDNAFSRGIREYGIENLSWQKKIKDLYAFFEKLFSSSRALFENNNEVHETQQIKKTKITFFAGDNNNFTFVNDIINHFNDLGYHTEKVQITSNDPNQIYLPLLNTDIAWFEWGNGPVITASNLPKCCKIVCRIHKYEVYSDAPYKINWKNIDDLIFINDHVYEQFKLFHYPNIHEITKVHVIKNSIKLENIPFTIKQKGFKLAFIARFHGAKNLSLMLQILKKLVDIDKRYCVYMLGRTQDETIYNYTNYFITEAGLENNFIYDGMSDNVFNWLKDKNYLLSTSIIEGLPVNVLEGMASGCKPVIHNYFANPSDIFGKKYVFNTIDEAVNMIISNDYDSEEYRKVIEEKYNFNKTVKRFEEIILNSNRIFINRNLNPRISIALYEIKNMKFLETALNGLLQQKYENYEILICVNFTLANDAKKLVKKFPGRKLRLLLIQSESIVKRKNEIIEKATGEFILWLGKNSFLNENSLKTISKYIKWFPNVDIFYSSQSHYELDSNLESIDNYNEWFGKKKDLLTSFLISNPLPSNELAINKNVYKKIGYYEENCIDHHEYEFLNRIIEHDQIHLKYIPETIISNFFDNKKEAQSRLYANNTERLMILDKLISTHSLHELFSEFKWFTKKEESKAEALFNIASKYFQLGAIEKSLDLFIESTKIIKPSNEKENLLWKIALSIDNPKAELLVSLLDEEYSSEAVSELVVNNKLKEISECINTQQYKTAITHLHQIKTLLRENKYDAINEENVNYMMGEVHLLQGDLVNAEKSFICALNFNSNNSLASTRLGEIYFKDSDYFLALLMFKLALYNDDGNQRAKELLSQVFEQLRLTDNSYSIIDFTSIQPNVKEKIDTELIHFELKENPDFNKIENFISKKLSLIFDENELKINSNNKSYNSLIREYFNFSIVKNIFLSGDKNNSRMLVEKLCYNGNQSTPLFTIGIITFNREQYISKAIDSALKQKGDFEVVIVDDGSTDNTENILKGYQSDRIKYFKKTHTNAPDSRNWIIKKSNGKYIIWLDSDDEMLPGLIEEYSRVLNENPDADIIYCNNIRLIDESGEQFNINYKSFNGNIDPSEFLQGPPIPNVGTLVKKELYERVGNYNAEFIRAHDFEFWVRALESAKFFHCNKSLMFHRIHKNGNLSPISYKDTDTSFEIRILDFILSKYPAEKLFKEIKWNELSQEDRNKLDAQINFLFAAAYNKWKYYEKAVKYAQKSLKINYTNEVETFLQDLQPATNQENLKITALISSYNEGDIIYHVIKNLIDQNIDVYLIDHHSNDNTVEVASKFLGKGLLKIETFPEESGYKIDKDVYAWRFILERKEKISKQLGMGWYIHADADEFRESPWIQHNLREAIIRVDSEGYNAINFNIYDFKPTNNDFVNGADVRMYLKFYSKPVLNFDNVQVKCWKYFGQEFDLRKSGGHLVEFKDRRIYPIPFILRHYPIRSQKHGEIKVFNERKKRFDTIEKKSQWHAQYDHIKDRSFNFLHREEDLIEYDRQVVCNDIQKQLATCKNNESPLLSILLITFNQYDYTKMCINSISEKARINHELIIVDNASTDETVKNIKSNFPEIRLLENRTNNGFPTAVNQGIASSLGKYVLLLNNDTIITEGLIERLIEVAESDSKIGIVGPISNEVSGVQKDKDANYKSIDEMHLYAASIREKNKNKITQFPRVAFLCTLIKKEVIDKIGGLDERFSPGNFEDDDFCLRAQLAGFKTVIANDVFIHHYGSKSFKADGERKYAERLKINHKIFVDKWGADPDEIWLKGKPFNQQRSLYISIDSDEFVKSFERAQKNIEDKEYGLAFAQLQKACLEFENSSKSISIISKEELTILTANIALINNEFENAKQYFEETLKLNPTSSEACFGLGQVFYQEEMFEQSKTMLEWAIKNDPQNQKAAEGLKAVNEILSLPSEHNSLIVDELVTTN